MKRGSERRETGKGKCETKGSAPGCRPHARFLRVGGLVQRLNVVGVQNDAMGGAAG